jgi:hypothetical protein
VLTHLARLSQRCAKAEGQKKWPYLLTRHDQMQYPQYQAAGWPIGSGMVESANKVVVEARLKGSGMRWKRANVNSLLILRNAVCHDQWKEYWQVATRQQQQRQQQQRQLHREQRRERLAMQVQVLLATMLLPSLHHHLTQPETPPEAAPTALPLARKGRTQAQNNWGRRPISRKGAPLAREFAKN